MDVTSEPDAPEAATSGDYCASDGGQPSPSPCAPGEVQQGRCGQCGERERTCTAGGAWSAWSECSESQDAECELCSTSQVGCGYCGTRPLSCRLVADTCRWSLGACDSPGICSPGSFELDPSTCAAGASLVRWCNAACGWDAWSACSSAVPAWDSPTSTPLSARSAFVSVTTSSLWIVWGGLDPQGAPLRDGALFDSATATWTPLSEALTPADDGGADAFGGRSGAAAVWTGQQLLIWGGQGQAPSDTLGDGARLDPASGSWTRISSVGAPMARADATMVWDDLSGRAVVWGGRAASGAAASGGGRYAPAADAWSAIAPSPLQARLGASVVWDPARRRMIVWGGRGPGGAARRDGAWYEPSSDSWAKIAEAPIAREGHFAAWDAADDRMLVFFGRDGFWTGQRADGAAWHPATDTWTLLSDLSITGYDIEDGWDAVVGGGYAWVTGGDDVGTGLSTPRGARYDLAHDAWSALPRMSTGRRDHAGAFFGRLVVWGGRSGAGWHTTAERLSALP